MIRARAARHACVASFVVATAQLSLTSAARAEGDDASTTTRADPRARAQQLFDSALDDAEAGNFASACPKFLASQEADPKTSTLLNLAACYEKNGQTASAWGAYREAETLARKAQRSDWESSARARAEALEPALLRLTISVPPASRIPGLVVSRDGVRISAGEWGVPIPVDAGEHLVVATADRHATWESRVSVREAGLTVSVPPLERTPEPAATAPATEDAPRRDAAAPVAGSWWTPMRTAGVIVAAGGVAALAASAVMGLVADGRYTDARGACADGARACPPSAVADSDSAYGLAGGATVMGIAGAALALGGGALILFGEPRTSASATAKTSARSGQPGVRIAVQPTSFGVHGQW